MTTEVQRALDEIDHAFSGHRLEVIEEPQGGGWAVVHGLDIGEHFTPQTSWVGFGVHFQYPYTDVYPHYLVPELTCHDGRSCNVPFQSNQLMPGVDRPATMLSRRSTNWNPAIDTAALKLQRILDFRRRGAT